MSGTAPDGMVRCAVRVRPQDDTTIPSTVTIRSATVLEVGSGEDAQAATVDWVFKPGDSQGDVYDKTVEPLVHRFVNETQNVALVVLGGVDQSVGTLVAYVGSEVRGTQDTPSSPPFGPYASRSMFQITLYADAGGESIRFDFLSAGGASASFANSVGNRESTNCDANFGNQSSAPRRSGGPCDCDWSAPEPPSSSGSPGPLWYKSSQ